MFKPSFIPPHSIHICVTVLHTQQGVADRFIRDVKEQVAIIMKNPKEKTTGKVCQQKVCVLKTNKQILSNRELKCKNLIIRSIRQRGCPILAQGER